MSLKVLLADDSMTAQNMAKKILADSGYDITTVSNGAAAVKKIAELKPDLVILDIYMPGYTGLEVCERVRANVETSRMPVLLTVGKMEPYRPEDGARVQADGIIVKPFEASDLLALVQKFADKKNGSAPVPVEEVAEPEPAEEPEPQESMPEKSEIPPEMAVAPAMLDVFTSDFPEPQPQSTLPKEWVPELDPMGTDDESLPAMPQFDAASVPFTPESFGHDEFSSTPGIPLDMVEPEIAATPVENVPAPEIEFTSAAPVELDAVQAEGFEPTIEAHAEPESISVDPALVTDPTGIMEFTTKFTEPSPAEIELESEPVATESVEAEPTENPEVPVDDFEARVAAAMAAFEQPTVEDVVQVPEPISDEALVEPTQTAEATTESLPEPVVEAVAEELVAPQVNLDEAMVLPSEAVLSLEEEMKKAMAEKEAAELAVPEVPNPPENLHVEVETASEPEVTEAELLPEESNVAFTTETVAPELEPEPVAVAEELPVEDVEPQAAPEPTVEAVPEMMIFEDVNEPVAAGVAEQVEAAPEPQEQPPLSEYVAPAAMAAAAAAGASSVAGDKLADAVQKAIDRLKPQLIDAILKELKGE